MSSARMAGLLYLAVILTGLFGIGYVPSQLNAGGDPAATVANVLQLEPLFRAGIASSALCYTAFLLLPLALFRLLSPVSRPAAVLMVAFAVVSVPISFSSLLHRLDALALVHDANYLQAFGVAQRDAQVMLLFDAYRNTLLVAKLFWGLWLLPLGYLVFKSGFLPRTLGVLLALGCAGYVVDVFARLLWPDYPQQAFARYVPRPASLAEIATCLWLLIAGGRRRSRE